MASSIVTPAATTLRFVTRIYPSQDERRPTPSRREDVSCRRDTVGASDRHIRIRSGFLSGTGS
jgi:hypothetical protein